MPVPVPSFLGFTLVVELLAPGKGKVQLRTTALVEIDLQRYERHAFALHGSDQLAYLVLVEKQLASSTRLVIEAVGLQIFRDMGIDQPDFTAFFCRVGFGDVGLA